MANPLQTPFRSKLKKRLVIQKSERCYWNSFRRKTEVAGTIRKGRVFLALAGSPHGFYAWSHRVRAYHRYGGICLEHDDGRRAGTNSDRLRFGDAHEKSGASARTVSGKLQHQLKMKTK